MVVVLPRGVMNWSAVCDFGISWSYLLTFSCLFQRSLQRYLSTVQPQHSDGGVAINLSTSTLICTEVSSTLNIPHSKKNENRFLIY